MHCFHNIVEGWWGNVPLTSCKYQWFLERWLSVTSVRFRGPVSTREKLGLWRICSLVRTTPSGSVKNHGDHCEAGFLWPPVSLTATTIRLRCPSMPSTWVATITYSHHYQGVVSITSDKRRHWCTIVFNSKTIPLCIWLKTTNSIIWFSCNIMQLDNTVFI